MLSLVCPMSFFPFRTGSALCNNKLAAEFVLPVRKAIQQLSKTQKALSKWKILETGDQNNSTQTIPVQMFTVDSSMLANGPVVTVRKLKAPFSALVSSCTWHSFATPFS